MPSTQWRKMLTYLIMTLNYKLGLQKVVWYKFGPCGLYYEHMTIVNDDSGVISKWSFRFIDDPRVVIYDRHWFIIQATGSTVAKNLTRNPKWRVWIRERDNSEKRFVGLAPGLESCITCNRWFFWISNSEKILTKILPPKSRN